jgi:capsular exopolysaccharide synthesis family protein
VPRNDVFEKEPSKVAEHLRLIHKYKWVFIVNAILCGTAAFVITRFQPPEYEASASVEINDEMNDLAGNFQPGAPTPTPMPAAVDPTQLQTQIEILHSKSLIGRVVSALKLDVNAAPEEPSRKDRLSKLLGFPVGTPATPRESAIADAQRHLDVSPVRGSALIKITFTSGRPELAARFVNTLTHEFIEQHLELRLASTSRTRQWLTGQLQELQARLQRSEKELQAYATASGMVYTGSKDRTNVADDKMRLIQDELSKAQADRIVKETRFELAQKGPPEALPEVLDNPSWHEYETKLITLRQQLADLKALYEPNYYKVQQLEAEVKELSGALDRQRTSLLKRIENEYGAASRREELLLRAYKEQANLISDQDAKAVQYNILKDEVDTNRQLYDAMLQKVKALGVNSAMRASNLVVVDAAETPSSPVRPQPIVNLAAGLTAGAFFAFVFVYIRERSDRRFRAPEEAVSYLSLPGLGSIPSLSADLKYAKRYLGHVPAGRDNNLSLVPMTLVSGKTAELATLQRSPSLMAEAFRGVLASISLSDDVRGLRVIAVTSAKPNEGKTTVIVNLAIALTRMRRNVLIIDGDIHRPRLHQIFGLTNQTGLGDLLSKPAGDFDIEAHIRRDVLPGLSLLPAGLATNIPNQTLHKSKLDQLMRQLRREFDVILIDTPPILLAADARVISRCCEGVLLVVRMSDTRRDEALAAAQRLAMDGAPLIGTIINDYAPGSQAYHSYYGYHRT